MNYELGLATNGTNKNIVFYSCSFVPFVANPFFSVAGKNLSK